MTSIVHMSSGTWRFWRRFFWVLMLSINCAGLVFLRTYPFTDLPNHLAEATIFKYDGDPSTPLGTAFTSQVTWYRPAIAHIVICSLFPSVEWGNTLLYLLYVVAVPGLVVLISKQCGSDSTIPMLSVLTLWNFNVMWGFAGYTLAIPLVLLSFYIHVTGILRPSRWTSFMLALVFLALFWFHVLAFLFAGLCYVCVEIAHAVASRPARATPWGQGMPLLPACALLIVWNVRGFEIRQQSTLKFLKEYYLHHFLPDLPHRLSSLFIIDGQAVASGGYGRLTAWCFSAVLIALGAVCIYRMRHRSVQVSFPQTFTLLFALVALLCYCLLPAAIPGQNFVYQRFGVIVLLGMICVLSWAVPMFWSGLPRYAAVIAAAAYSLVWLDYFLEFHQVSSEFVEFFPRDRAVAESSVAALICDADFRGHASLVHYNNYQIIWNKGLATTKLAEYRFGAIRRGVNTLPPYDEWIGSAEGGDTAAAVGRLAPEIDSYKSCDYLMAHGDIALDLLRTRSDYVVVRRSKTWMLAKHIPENHH